MYNYGERDHELCEIVAPWTDEHGELKKDAPENVKKARKELDELSEKQRKEMIEACEM